MKTVLKMLLKLLDGNINKVVREEIPPMSYETIIKQVKMLSEPLLVSVSPFIKLFESAQCNFTENHAGHAKQKTNKLFCISGKTAS